MISVNIMGQTIHITLVSLVALAHPFTRLHPYYRDLENTRNFLYSWRTGGISVEVVHKEYLGQVSAQTIWIFFTRPGHPSPNPELSGQSLVLGNLLSLGFIKNFILFDLQRKPIGKISCLTRMDIKYSF